MALEGLEEQDLCIFTWYPYDFAWFWNAWRSRFYAFLHGIRMILYGFGSLEEQNLRIFTWYPHDFA